MPIMTTLVKGRPRSRAMRAAFTAWTTISPAVRLRCNPPSPVAQKAQPTAHPTWQDTQIVKGYANKASINIGESITFQISSTGGAAWFASHASNS